MDHQFFLRDREGVSPMSSSQVFEGSGNSPPVTKQGDGKAVFPYVAFDIETYSPNGFPEQKQDPVVTATLVYSLSSDPRDVLISLSLIFPPEREKTLLMWLNRFLCVSQGDLVTYNGAKFDLGYVDHRGRLYGIDFTDTLAHLGHLDVYQVVKGAKLSLTRYGQKAVERRMRVNRVVNDSTEPLITGRSASF